MKFIKIMTEYEMRLSDGSFVEAANYIILTEDEFNEEILREFTEMESNDDIKVKSTKIIEMTPEEVSEAKTEEIIHHIMPGIYIESLNLPKDISIRECSKLTSGSVNHALALKQFTEKYCIYEKLTKDLDLTKVTVAELFDKIEKVYAARLTEDYQAVYQEAINE